MLSTGSFVEAIMVVAAMDGEGLWSVDDRPMNEDHSLASFRGDWSLRIYRAMMSSAC